MASPTFRLAAVLRVRELQENQAKGQVGLAQAALNRAEREAADRDAVALAYQPLATADPATYQANLIYGLTRAADAARAHQRVTDAANVVKDRQLDWQEAKQRVKPLERLAETHQHALRFADEKAAQQAGDEVAATRHEATRRARKTPLQPPQETA